MNPDSSTALDLQSLSTWMEQVAKNRDKQAFTELFNHYVPLIRAYSLAREPGAGLLADELAQEVMIKVWVNAGSYNPRLANLNTWVYTLARNCRIDYFRRNSRQVCDIDPADVFSTLEDQSPGPLQLVQQQGLALGIKTDIDKLPAAQAQVLRKVYLEGKSQQQTSAELNLPLGTVKSRIRLALNKLEILMRR